MIFRTSTVTICYRSTPSFSVQYTDKEVNFLRFIKRARNLGFSVPEISELLRLWQNRQRSSESVKRIAPVHIADLDERIQAFVAMKQALQHLVDCCRGDHGPECPILDELNWCVMIIRESILTCPNCGHAKTETMPTDACQWFYECEHCHMLLIDISLNHDNLQDSYALYLYRRMLEASYPLMMS